MSLNVVVVKTKQLKKIKHSLHRIIDRLVYNSLAITKQTSTTDGFSCDETFDRYQDNEAAVAQIYDTDELMRTLLNFFLFKVS